VAVKYYSSPKGVTGWQQNEKMLLLSNKKLYLLTETQSAMAKKSYLIILIVIIILSNLYSFGQNANEAVVPPITGKFPTDKKYRKPAFENGYLITVLDKRSQNFRLNFDLDAGQPQFINEKGDTLYVDKHLAKYVRINELMYFHDFSDNEYYEILNNSPIKLAIQRKWRLARYQPVVVQQAKDAGIIVGGTQNTRSNTVYSPVFSKMVRNENTIFKRDSSYFFIDNRNNVHKVNERNLLKIFEKDKSRVNDYLQKESIDFKKEEDLKKVLQFAISNH
jgi:hypothetical protein